MGVRPQTFTARFQRIAVNMDMHGGEASIEAAVKQILRRIAPLKHKEAGLPLPLAFITPSIDGA